MVILGISATMKCDEPDCPEKQGANLILLTSGGFGFQPLGNAKGWQVRMAQNGAFNCLCPDHARLVEEASPVIPDAQTLRRVQ